MKYSKLFAVIAVISTVIFTDCSKTADPVAAAAPSLVGTWKETSNSITGCTGTLSSLNHTETPCSISCGTYVFTTTTYTYSNTLGSSGSGTYTTSGSTFTIPGGVGGTYTYTVTATTLTTSYVGGGCVFVSK